MGNRLVDECDFQILSQLRKNPFLSYETLGREMGLSGNAVKSRLEALEKAKILSLLHGMPAARVFHRFPRLFFFREPATSQEKLDVAIEIDPAVFLTQDVNQKVGVLTYDLSPHPRPPEKLVALLGPTELEVTPLIPHPQGELSKPVSLSELKVLRVLVANLRVPLKEISQAAGLSQKITKKIRTQLLDDGLLQVQPIFQSAQSQGILMYEVDVHYDNPTALSRIRQALPKSVIFNQWEPTAVVFSCWAESLAEVFETEKRLRDEPAVREVRVKFHLRAILSTSRLVSWIDEEIQRLGKSREVR
jgi:DNA-binding Lrp family transcriptional regulator